MTSDNDPFHDCELDPETILGTHTFEDVLFTDDTETPVNVLTGETPAHSSKKRRSSLRVSTRDAQDRSPASVESQIETQSKPYTAAAFFNFKTTDSLERHRAYHAAYETDAFAVDFEADYESGDLTITVERADEA
mgnify:CR=1 FL=1